MPWDRELFVLEEALRRVTAEYDAFLYGSASRPPVESRRHIEQMIRQLNAAPSDSAADRYRFSTLQGRYSALCERWERLQGEKEAGRRPGLYGHFRDARADSEPVRAPRPGAASSASNARAPASVTQGRGEAPLERDLFDRYVAAKKAHGENVNGYRYEQFLESLQKEQQKLRERLGVENVLFDVVEREGRVRLVAKREGAKGSEKP